MDNKGSAGQPQIRYKGPVLNSLPIEFSRTLEAALTAMNGKSETVLEISSATDAWPEQCRPYSELYQTDLGFFSAYFYRLGRTAYVMALKTPAGSMAVDRDVGKAIGFNAKQMTIVDRPAPGVLIFTRAG